MNGSFSDIVLYVIAVLLAVAVGLLIVLVRRPTKPQLMPVKFDGAVRDTIVVEMQQAATAAMDQIEYKLKDYAEARQIRDLASFLEKQSQMISLLNEQPRAMRASVLLFAYNKRNEQLQEAEKSLSAALSAQRVGGMPNRGSGEMRYGNMYDEAVDRVQAQADALRTAVMELINQLAALGANTSA